MYFGQNGDLGNAGLPVSRRERPVYRGDFKVTLGRRFPRTEGDTCGGAGGMSGTASKGSLGIILQEFSKIMQGEEWELVDVGAGSGVVVAMSFTYGASLAVGVELKDEGQAAIFALSLQKLAKFGVQSARAHIQYGVDISTCTRLPTLQTPPRPMHKAVFAFCDGFAEKDRAHMFALIGGDALVRVFMCSCGRGKDDLYRQPVSVLNALNASVASGTVFAQTHPITVSMCGSHSQKTIHVFVRQT